MQAPDFSLVKIQFGHDCRNLGCNLPDCELCRNNPDRRCQVHFREKYVDNANRVFMAWCKAPILARMVDAVTGDEYVSEDGFSIPSRLEGVVLELCLLEGTAYEQKEIEVGADNITGQDFESLMLLDNTSSSSKSEPLLVPGKNCPGEHTVMNKLRVPLEAGGTHILVRTSRSSQSAQGGRTRPFRLMARAVWTDGTPVPYILPDVSDPFVVTTRRTQGAEKALIPRWEDSVNKLPGVGKETVLKLKDLGAAGLVTRLANNRIHTVGQLYELLEGADSVLIQDLGRTLGLRPDKMLELQECVRTVAREDSRKRVWGSPEYPSDRLLYPCSAGAVNLVKEHIEVMRDTDDGAEIIETSDLPPEDLERVIEMRRVAFSSWWAPGHPGWGIIDELSLPANGEFPVEEGRRDNRLLHTLSLRQQMDRQCKQRRVLEPEQEAFPDPVEYQHESSHLRPADQYLGVTAKQASIKEEPDFDNYSQHRNSVIAPDHVNPGPSVFDLDAYPEGHEYEGTAGELREINPNAQDISTVQSAGSLLEQPIGLAYITSAPLFERSGPIRFKRSQSGNRYKPMASETSHPSVVVNNGYAAENQPSPLHHHQQQPSYMQPQQQQQQNQPPVGVFQGLQQKPSRELRSQTSLNKVEAWQQTRPLSSSSLGERFSYSLLADLCGEGEIDYELAQKFGF